MFLQNVPHNKYLEQACDIIINGALKYNFILEVNANGFRKGKQSFIDGERYPYPYDSFWKKLSVTEIKTIVGSDCHSPDFIYDKYVDMAVDYCRELKLNLITEL